MKPRCTLSPTHRFILSALLILAVVESASAELPAAAVEALAEPGAGEADATESTDGTVKKGAIAAVEGEQATADADAASESPPGVAEAPVVAPVDQAGTSTRSWTDYVFFKGDFRYRFELIDIEDTDDAKVRYRHRIRGRLGVHADLLDGLRIGFQLATGSPDPVSTNQTLSDAFSTKPIWIDLAYAAFEPDYLSGLSAVAGKMKNPFRSPQKTELVWDGDLNPEGVSLGYEGHVGVVAPFFQAGGFFVEERSGAENSWLLGVQAGVAIELADGLFYVSGGVGYFDHTEIAGSTLYFDASDSYGNTAVAADPDDPQSEDRAYVYDYNMIDVYLEVGGKLWRFPWSAFGHLVKNTAENVDDDLGWLVGLKLGRTKKPLDFDLMYTYRVVERDAVLGAFTDSDFAGGGTGGKGHEWQAGFQVAEAMKIGGTYFFNKHPVDPPAGVSEESYHRFQLDLSFKF